MRISLVPFVLFALMLGVTAYAQVPVTGVPVAPPPQPVELGGKTTPPDGSPASAGGQDGSPSEPAATPVSPRMTKLKQLNFDRRPSTILKEWAPKPKDDKAPTPKDAKEAELQKELAEFQKHVTLGNWPAVKAYIATLPDEEAIVAYRRLLQSLQQRPGMSRGGPGGPDGDEMMMGGPGGNPGQQFAEKHTFTTDDLLGLAAAAPHGTNPKEFPHRAAIVGAPAILGSAPAGIGKQQLSSLASILREVVAGGTLPEVAVARLKTEVARTEGQAVLTRRQVARLLLSSGLPEFAGDFLPTSEQAQKDADLEALNLLARHFVALHAKEREAGNLEKAWAAVQAILAAPAGLPEEKEEGLLRAVELAPRLKDELGQAWLDASFTQNPERGMEILATVGSLVSRGLSTKPFATEDRLNALKLSQTAVEALLKAAPDRAKQWRPVLTLLAAGWLTEADFSQRFDRSASSGPQLRRDIYGNIFFTSGDDDDPMNRMMMMQQRPDMPRPVTIADVIKAAPSPAWVAAVDDSLRPKLAGMVARLHLKANQEDKAFPLIEQLAASQPVEAKELVKEFLRVWTRNHDPNSARNQYRYSWYFFGFEQRAEAIPLTRSKQERNLKELSEWSARIKKLPGGAGDLDDELMVKAFTACHSSAEVYRTEAIEAVFGPLGGLKPRTLAGLADQMRTNLAGLWRAPAVQEQNKTKRKKKDIEAEVLRGYAVARQSVADGLKKFPDHWALLAAAAGLMHDELNFRQELAKSSEFSKNRALAFAVYQKAAADYARAVRELPESEHTTSVFEQWFAASLGAVDLGMITEDQQPDWTQPPLIRAAILALPGELAEKHMARFANNLFIKMSGAKPHVKFNYLKAGFQVVGDHERAAEAKKVFDYYKDLVTEIKLDAIIDGSSRVGHGQPFGLFVNIRHTRDIERESNGFGRYLQNQNSSSFSYNYGRPTADYRDRFEAAAREALKEHFEVISVAFQDEKVNSRATEEFGWRYTPYAYILLKPRGPQVDKIPPLRLDLDFLDTSGYVVMPVETPAVPIDARDATGDLRPVEKLVVTQTLDERQANKGTLLLEVKAVGIGLVPDFQALCGSFAPEGFDVTAIEDQGVAVKKFDEDADRNAIVSERTWTLTLKGKDGQTALPRTFRFASVKLPTKEVIYQRYNDADLAAVGEEVALEHAYGKQAGVSLWVIIAAVVAGLLAIGVVIFVATRPKRVISGSSIPENLDPFVAAALLRDIRERPELTVAQRAALDQDLAEVERFYFSGTANGQPPPDLRSLVERWAASVPGWQSDRTVPAVA